MATSALPAASTPQQPPNFYQQAAQMSSGPSAAGAKNSPNDKQEFLKDVTKLLTILDKMGKRKPNGVDISKYMQTASDAVQKALEASSGKGDTSSGTPADSTGDAEASAGAQTPADTGSTGPTA